MSRLKQFRTSYNVNKSKYGSHVFAKSLSHASQVVEERGIGETILGYAGIQIDGYGRKVPEQISNPDFTDLNDYDFIQNLPQIIHSACFLGFIAVSSGKISTEQLIGDEGVIHELVHLLNGSNLTTTNIRKARKLFIQLQKLVPSNFKEKK